MNICYADLQITQRQLGEPPTLPLGGKNANRPGNLYTALVARYDMGDNLETVT